MRYREFAKRAVGEAIPAIMQKDLRAVGPGVLQATKNLTTQIAGKLAIATGTGKPSAAQSSAGPAPQGAAAQPTSTAIQQAQLAAANKSTKPPDIPAVGSQLVLPDKDLKKPASFTIKSMRGNDIDLTPVGSKPNEPKVGVTVKKPDLQKALSALQGQRK